VHDAGGEVHVWTVDDPAVMARQIATGADGIITDYPTLLRSVMAELGMPLPPPYPPR